MKPLGSGMFLRSAPLAKRQVSPTDCLRYAMGSSGVGRDHRLRVDARSRAGAGRGVRIAAMTSADRKVVLARTAPAASKGEWEKYKTSGMFDGTARNPHWLEGATL